MRVLVTGGSASGKSEFAEQLLLSLAEAHALAEKFYIATMPIFSAEDEARKEKHLRARQGRGFITIEQAENLSSLRMPEKQGGRFALLEDIGNLAANEMFGANGISGAAMRVASGALSLAAQCDSAVIVSVDVARDGISYDPETREYIHIIEQVNRTLSAEFDAVYEVVCGIPVKVK